MDLWAEIRRRVTAGELSLREAARHYHLNFRTVAKAVEHPEPPAYCQARPRRKPVLGPFLSFIHDILDADRHAPPRQRHTARRIFERLRDEHGYPGCPSIVRAAVAGWRQSRAEAFVPLAHPPGQAQCDFGKAAAVVAGAAHDAALFVLTLPHSNARFACLSPRECAESFHDGHARAFAFLGGVPARVRYDNSRLAVVKLTGRHERRLSREFLRLQAHFAFAAELCGVRQAQEKGHVENGVGYVRRNFLVPVPQAGSWQELNDRLSADCQRELGRRGHSRGGAGPLAADQAAFLPLPATPYDARRVELVTVSSLALGRFDGNDYSVPTAWAYRTLTATGTLDHVRFSHQGNEVARHRRVWARGQVTFEPLRYLALLERKPFALDSAQPLAGWELPECFSLLRRRLEQADPKGGTRQYVRVLRLLERHELARVEAAVTRALALAALDADAVRLLAERDAEQAAPAFDLAGRPGLQSVRLPAPDLRRYGELAGTKGTRGRNN